MSTLTYYPRSKNEYSLRFNRDTSKKRGTAKLPQVFRKGNVQVVYPLDKVASGPWVAVQSNGTTFAVLNRPRIEKKIGERSRDRLILKLLGSMSEGEIRSKVQALDQQSYSPFGLVCIIQHPDDGFKILNWEWDGRIMTSLDKQNKPQLWSTSAREEISARRYRQHQWEKLITLNGEPTEEILHDFHFSTQVCNDLTPACKGIKEQTASISEIYVREDSISFHYHDGGPWIEMPSHQITIQRAFGSQEDEKPLRQGVEIKPENRLQA